MKTVKKKQIELEVDQLLIQIMSSTMNDFGKFLNGFSKELLFLAVFTQKENEQELLYNAAAALEKIANKINGENLD
jgi:hypothetical protein